MKIQDRDLLRRQAYLGGEWIEADSGLTLTVTDPATGEVIAEVPAMGMAETRRASRWQGTLRAVRSPPCCCAPQGAMKVPRVRCLGFAMHCRFRACTIWSR